MISDYYSLLFGGGLSFSVFLRKSESFKISQQIFYIVLKLIILNIYFTDYYSVPEVERIEYANEELKKKIVKMK